MDERPITHVWAIVQDWMDSHWPQVSQAQLAKRMGVSKSTISAWKYGDTQPEPEDIRALASICEKPREQLVDAWLRDVGLREKPDPKAV